jgi:prepilin-type N-terminal cleavage/methylation domain-containing protein
MYAPLPTLRPRLRGFTLVELLVSLFIALFLLSVTFQLLTGALKARKQTSARIQAFDSARTFFTRTFFSGYERELAGAYPLAWADPNAPDSIENLAVTEPPVGTVLQMTTSSEVVAPGGGYTQAVTVFSVRYFVRNDLLCRETSNNAPWSGHNHPFPDAPSAATLANVALFPNAEKLDVAFARWDEPNKRFDFTTAPHTDATHLEVTLTMQPRVNASERGKLDQVVFRRLLPIPEAFLP